MSARNDLVFALDHCWRLSEITEAIAFCEPRYAALSEKNRALASAAFVRASRRVLGRPPLVDLEGAIEALRKRQAKEQR